MGGVCGVDVAVGGIGDIAPYGLAIEWPTTAESRFLGYYSSVKGIYFQPTFGLKASDRISFGIGFDITSSEVELKQRVDLAEQEAAPGVTFANLGQAKRKFVDLEQTPAGWRIADIRGPNGALSALYKGR